VLLALQLVGAFESQLGWKRYPMTYEVRANVGETLGQEIVGTTRAEDLAREVAAARYRMQRAILKVLDAAGQRLAVQERDNVAGMERVAFSVVATRGGHEKMLQELRASDATDQVEVFLDAEEE
jgi:putative Mg2+ transporter-C (MgtC) family protein